MAYSELKLNNGLEKFKTKFWIFDRLALFLWDKVKKRRYIQFVLSLVVMLIVGGSVLVNSPRVQKRVSVILASELENRIGTQVGLGGVRWLFPNDLVIDSLVLNDQEGEQMLAVDRIAAKVEWMPLIRHRHLSVRNIRLFAPDINIYKNQGDSDYNFQFLIDAFASDKKEKESSRLSLRVNSLLVRHAKLRHRDGECSSADKFSPANLMVDDLSALLSLKMLSADSVSLIVRHLDLIERSGLEVDDLYFRLVANRQGATLANFHIGMPQSSLNLDTMWVAFNGTDSLFAVAQPSLYFKGGVLPSSYVAPADLRCLLPQLAGVNEKVYLGGYFVGSSSRVSLKDIDIHTAHRNLVLRADAKVAWNDGVLDNLNASLHEATLKGGVWSLLEEQAPELYELVPDPLVCVGDMTLMGTLGYNSESTAVEVQAETAAGDIEASMLLEDGKYTIDFRGDSLNVAQVIPESPLASTNLSLHAEGVFDEGCMTITDLLNRCEAEFPLVGSLTATATQTDLLGYEYDCITLNGDYAAGEYKAVATLDDLNGKLLLEAGYSTKGRLPRYTAKLIADSLNLHAMQLIDIHEQTTFSVQLDADLRGRDVDHVMGRIVVDSLAMHRSTGDYLIEEIAVYASDPKDKMISLKSDFMDATFRGELTYQSLVNSLFGHLHHSLPSLCQSKSHEHKYTSNLCLLNVGVYNTEPLRELFLLPISIDSKAQLEALINDVAGELKVTAMVPHLEYGDNTFRGVTLDCHSKDHGLDVYLGATLQNEESPTLTTSFVAQAADDIADLSVLWYCNPEGKFEGTFHTQAAFMLDEKGRIGVAIDADSTSATLNHSVWELDSFKLEMNADKILVDGLHFANGDMQHLSADGVIARQGADTLKVNFSNLDLGYLLSLVNLGGITFDGKVSGNANMANLYSEQPYVEGTLRAQDFAFCDGVMGDLNGNLHWNQDDARLLFEADVCEDPVHTSLIDGTVDLKRNELWIDIAADSLNVSFLNSLLKSFMRDIEGNASGNILVGGPMSAINLEGSLLTDVAFNLTPTDVDYRFKDSLRFTPGIIRFDGIEAFDMREQKAILNGAVTHNALKDFAYDLDVDIQNVLGIDLPDTGHDNFYTTIYGTGGVRVKGSPTMPLTIEVQAQPEKGSLFALNLANQNVSSSEAFITFTDHSSTRNVPVKTTPLRERRRRRTQVDNSSSLNLDVTAHVTPDATLKLVMNQAVDDHISVSGSGDLQISVQGDDINLFGTYTVDRGFYRLSLQDVVNKNFDVISGSSVAFEGDPMAARLDITARHVVNYVPLRDLSPDMTGNVHVNCLLRIGGTLEAPTVTFDLELPQGTEEEKAVLRSYTGTEEQMNLQFIYLLGLGKFYTPDMAQNTAAANNMESLISSTISGQINNLLSGIISNENWNLASNIRADNMMTGANDLNGENWENMEIEGILEGRLLDNRLLINGNFGYRDNPMYATNFIGDFDIRYLLTGGLSLKGYNKTNDRYFSKTSLTTQGVGLVFQRDFDSLKPRRKRKRKESKMLETIELTDSVMNNSNNIVEVEDTKY